MNLKQNIFLTGGHDLPTLYTDMVLVESTRAILFTCKSEFDDLYICACHCANSEKVEWLVAPTTPNRVIDLLTNKLTIRNMFDKESLLFLVTLMAGEKTKAIKKFLLQDIPPNILPSAGYYMDADENEFDEELAELRNLIQVDATSASFQMPFTYASLNFLVSIPTTHITRIKKGSGHKLVKSNLRCSRCRVGA